MRLKKHCWYYMAGINAAGGTYDGAIYRIEGFQCRREARNREPTCFMFTSGPWPKPAAKHWAVDPEYWLNSKGVNPWIVAKELPALEAAIYEGMYQAWNHQKYLSRRGVKALPRNSGGRP